jgi:hypothetical protein
VPVGVCLALEADDYATGTYRGHGHALAKGTVSPATGLRDAWPRPRRWPGRGSRPRSSTCAPSARSTSTPSRVGGASTNRLLAVEEGPRTGGWAAGLLGMVAERALHDLDDAWAVATGETPIPYSPPLEDAFIPDADAIVSSVRERLGVGAGRG